MEHNELDKLFRKTLTNDTDKVLDESQESKELIWSRLKLHRNARILPFWKIAAAILFLLFTGSVLHSYNLKNESLANMAAMEKKYLNLKIDFDESNKTVIAYKEQEMATSTDIVDGREASDSNGEEVIKEKKIYITDTIYVETISEPERIYVHQRDTIYLKEYSEPEGVGSLAEFTPELPENMKKRPSSVEFVFGTKVDTLNSNTRLSESSLVQINQSKSTAKNNKAVTFVTFSN